MDDVKFCAAKSADNIPTPSVSFEDRPARQSLRYRGGACTALIGGRGAQWECTVIDFSTQGLSLSVPRRFEPSEELAVRLRCADHETHPIVVKVCYCVEHHGNFRIGVSISFRSPINQPAKGAFDAFISEALSNGAEPCF